MINALNPNTQLLLTASEMTEADKAAVVAGVPAIDLMAAAGKTVVDALMQRWSKCSVLVLCGPGNNGGNGFVVAQLLGSVGWPVRLAFMGAVEKLSPEAKYFYQAWQGEVEALRIPTFISSTWFPIEEGLTPQITFFLLFHNGRFSGSFWLNSNKTILASLLSYLIGNDDDNLASLPLSQ
ncbi:NAD(P)H-hydrate epimerase [Marinomonas sp. RS-M-Aa-14]|uniref:NAD(P)H-hydrate epimerase n=1 Tax=Marinomonas sp. RS-M-Aa-14 TaxID=3241169 RepID=UPI003AAF1F4F